MTDKNNPGDYPGVVKALKNVAKAIDEMMEQIKPSKVILKSLTELSNYFESLPKDAKETEFYHKVLSLKKSELHYEDIKWLTESYSFADSDEAKEILLENFDVNIELHRYLKSILQSDAIGKREKVIVFLAHSEALIYDVLDYTRERWDKVKQVVMNKYVSKSKGLSTKNFGLIYILGISFIIFSNTDNYKREVDKRVPFRNHILHRGIVSYTDEDIETVYNMLIDYFAILVDLKIRLNSTNTNE